MTLAGIRAAAQRGTVGAAGSTAAETPSKNIG